jgi:hypothetical protein
MKRVFSVLLLFFFIICFSFIVVAGDYCGGEDGELCASAGEHCCTSIGPAKKTWDHPVFAEGQWWTCSEYTLFRYQSYNCMFCPFHWNEPENSS